MNDYLAFQVQQIDRAKTFADIRRIEDRASRIGQATPEARRGRAWSLRAWSLRARAAAHVRSRREIRAIPASRWSRSRAASAAGSHGHATG
jgi:hypothetical protein